MRWILANGGFQHLKEATGYLVLRQGVRIAGDEFVGCCIVAALRARHLYIEHGIVHLSHDSLAASKHWDF